MKLGIMQPYFFPYLGYFDLIDRADRWIVFDIVKFSPKTWITRNRILHPKTGWQYINIPVRKMPFGTPVQEIRVQDKHAALERILGQVSHYQKYAPFYTDVVDLVRTTFSATKSDSVVELNVQSLRHCCAYLGIEFDWEIFSDMNLSLNEIRHAGQWALRIGQAVGAEEYINPPGGRNIFKPEEWSEAGIELTFTDMPDLRYDCGPYGFCEHLSILDVLMWNGPETVLAGLPGRN